MADPDDPGPAVPPWLTAGGWLIAVVALLVTGFLMIRNDNRRLDAIERHLDSQERR